MMQVPNPLTQKHPDMIAWTADGAEVIINRLSEVETKVLPDYFRHQNFASFVRQVPNKLRS